MSGDPYIPLEPEIRALDALKALVLEARVVTRRLVNLPALGVAIPSEIAFASDADYAAGAEKLVMKCEQSAHGLITETANLPAAFVFPGDSAALEDGVRPNDSPAFEVEFRLAFKRRDTPGNDEARQRARCVVRDFVRRLRLEKAASIAQGGTLRIDAVAENAGAGAGNTDRGFVFFDVPIILAHDGELLAE